MPKEEEEEELDQFLEEKVNAFFGIFVIIFFLILQSYIALLNCMNMTYEILISFPST